MGTSAGERGPAILQQKVLTPNDFPSLAAVAERLAQFERHYEQIAQLLFDPGCVVLWPDALNGRSARVSQKKVYAQHDRRESSDGEDARALPDDSGLA